jgi:hypothetical protein
MSSLSKLSATRSRKAFFLLLGCICFFVAGTAMLTIGALSHVNPKVSLAGLFKLEPLMNLVYSIIPGF